MAGTQPAKVLLIDRQFLTAQLTMCVNELARYQDAHYWSSKAPGQPCGYQGTYACSPMRICTLCPLSFLRISCRVRPRSKSFKDLLAKQVSNESDHHTAFEIGDLNPNWHRECTLA